MIRHQWVVRQVQLQFLHPGGRNASLIGYSHGQNGFGCTREELLDKVHDIIRDDGSLRPNPI